MCLGVRALVSLFFASSFNRGNYEEVWFWRFRPNDRVERGHLCRPNIFISQQDDYAWPRHAEHAGHENEQEQARRAKEENSDKKTEASKETEHGQHARHEHAWNEYVGDAQADAPKETDGAKKAIN